MQRQISFAEAESAGKKRVTKRQRFLAEMEKVVPWSRLLSVIEPYYPKGERGRPPIGLERMLRIYFLQQWYGLSDEGLEDALYDSIAMRAFAGIDLSVENAPDATTLLKFRRLLVEHNLTRKLFDEIGISLCERGLMMKEGTLVDATIIEAPSSTKNGGKSRDPEMHQTKKGNEWHFGMKAHVGVDAESGLVHSVVGTAANVSDVSQAHALLHGHEEEAFGDAGYIGVDKRDEMQAKPVKWRVAAKRGKIKAMQEGALKDLLDSLQDGFGQLIAQAHRRGVRIIGVTLTPFEDALHGTPLYNYFSVDKDALRQSLNTWIRESGAFDAVLDFDLLAKDRKDPSRLDPGLDSEDHLHPGNAGNRALANAIPLDILLPELGKADAGCSNPAGTAHRDHAVHRRSLGRP